MNKRSAVSFIVLGLLLLAGASPLQAQERQAVPASAARLVDGGLAGGGLGAVVGGVAGLLITATSCSDSGNPDSCGGLEGTALGIYAGYAIGAPLGVHLANRGRGSVTYSLLVSAGLAAVGGLLIHSADSRAEAGKQATPAVLATVAIGIPVTQLAVSTLIERATTRRR